MNMIQRLLIGEVKTKNERFSENLLSVLLCSYPNLIIRSV